MFSFFGKKTLESDAKRTFSEKIKVNDRVKHRQSSRLGTVIQTGVVDGSFKLPALSVRHGDGTESWLVPAEDYTKAVRVNG